MRPGLINDRKGVEMLFAHLKGILRLGRLRLRAPARRSVRVHVGGNSNITGQPTRSLLPNKKRKV
jgi:hypothetical protein